MLGKMTDRRCMRQQHATASFVKGEYHPRPLSGMVGATGIEPVTPTMSIVVDANAKVELCEICS